WFYLDEFDLLLLLTAAIGYWRIRADDARAQLPAFFLFALGFVGCCFLVAAFIGATPLAPLDANAFSNYSSRYNSLRVLKGFVWAIVLLPLLRRSVGPDLAKLQRYFVPGMLLGLAFACLAVIWERAVFPGLLNFSSDYRPTAPFSAMHTGGAALDAYLAISFPFAASWLIGARPRYQLALALLLLLLGSYAGLTIFSRDIYLAYGSSGAIVLALVFARRARQGSLNAVTLVGWTLALALTAYTLTHVFASGGYRGLGAALVLLVAAILLAGSTRRLGQLGLSAGAALVLTLLVFALFVLFDKGAYLGFLLAAAVFALASVYLFFGDGAKAGPAMAIACAAFPAMAGGAGLVAWHWGGGAALADTAVLIALAGGALAVNRLLPQPVLRLTRINLTLTLCCAIVFATVIPVASSYYLGSRFATVGDDFALRTRHWSEAIDMMEPGFVTSLFGMGLGRYPDVYAWKNTHGELPGSFSYERDANGNQFLRLGAPQYAIGYGEVLRVLQHVDLSGGPRYRLALDMRRPTAQGAVSIALCERWMLYPQNCVGAPLKPAGAEGAWVHYDVLLDAAALAGDAGTRGAPVQLEIANFGGSATIDVDNLSLREAGAGPELIRNGSFEHGNDYWFFSSDRNHLPWHVKNFAVNTFFEQGWIGVFATALLLLYAAGDLALRGLHGETPASIALAAMAGFLVVGMFDSLFDVPRLTLLFFLVLCGAMLRPAKQPARHRVRRRKVARSEDQVPDLIA
ncbi:MAG TPA: hypothetical protein VFG03_10900, partial [Telluria sp.]|nr:hypothetical protein [Telluria sp.]